MNFRLTIYILELVVLFGSGFGGSQVPPESPHLSLPPSGAGLHFLPYLQWGLMTLVPYSLFIEESWEGKDSPLVLMLDLSWRTL